MKNTRVSALARPDAAALRPVEWALIAAVWAFYGAMSVDPSVFLRVHRSVIVRLELVEVLHRTPGGDYQVQLRSGTRLPVSRSRHEALERWLGTAR